MERGDVIGSRGENICALLLTTLCGNQTLPYFRPQFLGEKYRTIDFIVEVVDANRQPGSFIPFFFIQVKSTADGYTVRERKLKVKLSLQDAERLASYPAPTYLVGIDERTQQGYIMYINPNNVRSIASLTTRYPLDCHHLLLLRDEVRDFWTQAGRRPVQSRFDV